MLTNGVNILAKDLVVMTVEVKRCWSIKLITNPAAVVDILLSEGNDHGCPLQEKQHSIFPDIIQLNSKRSMPAQVVHIQSIKQYLLWARTVNCAAAGPESQGADDKDGENGNCDDSEKVGRKRKKISNTAGFRGSVVRVPQHRMGFESVFFMILNIERLMCNVVKRSCDLSVGDFAQKLFGLHCYGQDEVDKLRKEMPGILHGHIAEWFTANNVLNKNLKFLTGVVTDEQVGNLVRCFYVGKRWQRVSDTEVRLLSIYHYPKPY